MTESTFTILAGRDYTYTGTGAYNGHRYRVHRFVLDVPVYSTKVLVECLSGPSEGEWFVVSPDNFARRYTLAEEVSDEKPETSGLVQVVEEVEPDVPAAEEKTMANYW